MKTAVLVVDDEQVDVTVITQILQVQCGFTGFGAADYWAAMEVFEAHADGISLLIADISLPGRTGIELAKTLFRKKPGLKVLLISGYVGAAQLRFEGIPPTDLHFLVKPFRSSELVKRVREVMASDEAVRWLESEPETASRAG